MGCGCSKKRLTAPVSSATPRQMASPGPTVTYILVDSNNNQVSTHDTLDAARDAWNVYKNTVDSGARLLQRTSQA